MDKKSCRKLVHRYGGLKFAKTTWYLDKNEWRSELYDSDSCTSLSVQELMT